MSISFLILATIFMPVTQASAGCQFNGNGSCMVNTGTDLELLNDGGNQTINWKIRPQNIGFMYYLRLKNWTPNDTVLEGFLVTIMDHDSNETIESYELTMREKFEHFAENNDVLEMRLELDDVLNFDKRYDAKINILPIGKQAPASSFLSVMGKLEGEKCSAMTGLAERWAPHVIVDVFETTSEVELSWKPAPDFLCIKTYEIVLQNRDGLILNTTEIEVNLGQKIVNTTFQGIEKDQLVQLKVRGKNALDGGCACVNCNCITDKTKYFMIPTVIKEEVTPTTPIAQIHHEPSTFTGLQIFMMACGAAFIVLLVAACSCCKRFKKAIYKQKITFNNIKTKQYPNRKSKKTHKIMVVCPEVTGRDLEYMTRIGEAFKKSKHTVVCDKWRENSRDAEKNMLQWVYEQTRIADKIVVFHSANYASRCCVYDVVNNFFPCTDPRLVHIALSAPAQRKLPKETEFVMPRDQQHLEEAFNISITDPLVIEIPEDVVVVPVHHESYESIEEEQQINSKSHSTDSGVSSMSSNSSESGSSGEKVMEITTHVKIPMQEMSVESHPLLQQPIAVS
uniref:SEFIR domain-containing protein n=1 Tax=Caenorhabditis tropicalis TaxID=1561998 RepID=A0A1I7TRR5_9PELO